MVLMLLFAILLGFMGWMTMVRLVVCFESTVCCVMLCAVVFWFLLKVVSTSSMFGMSCWVSLWLLNMVALVRTIF